jgi:hypothetical protein
MTPGASAEKCSSPQRKWFLIPDSLGNQLKSAIILSFFAFNLKYYQYITLFQGHLEFKGTNLLYSYILATLLFSQEKNTAKAFR